ncbi:MAG: N-acetylmuramoyl-L-alanine amidase, partial [Alistipes sp.]|nr:N-acetylmuramoyl-L-alanine amidase [Alistipes sp.]
MSRLRILLDNGHGNNTPGKRSPEWADGSQLLEYECNRDTVRRVALKLDREGIPYHIITPEEFDVP